jgi:hypothetical protein
MEGADMSSRPEKSRSLAPIIGIVAGIMVAIGVFLPWAKASASGLSESASGISGWEGKVCLIAAAAIVIRSFMSMKQGWTRQLAVAILIGGLVVTAVSVYTATTATSQVGDSVVDELLSQGVVSDEAAAQAAVDQAMDAGLIQVSVLFGLYLVIAGGVLSIAAGATAFAGAPSTQATPAGFDTPAVPVGGTSPEPGHASAPPVTPVPPETSPSAPPGSAPPPASPTTPLPPEEPPPPAP